MQRIRIQKKKSRYEPDYDGSLPLDPRDPDVVRAKAGEREREDRQKREVA